MFTQQTLVQAEEQAAIAAGLRFTGDQADCVEQQLVSSPADSCCRVMLAAYYSYREDAPNHLNKYQEHVGWLIQNRPTCELLSDSHIYLKLRKAPMAVVEFGRLWSGHLRTAQENPKYLRNAAEFWVHFDLASAERLLLRAQQLEPTNELFSTLLTNLAYRRERTHSHLPVEDLKLRIAKWQVKADEARKSGDEELAGVALARKRQFEIELAEMMVRTQSRMTAAV